jgi:glycosyltransferase involved in cell wall biosynthesis
MVGPVGAGVIGSSLLFGQLVDRLRATDGVQLRVINTVRAARLTRNWFANFSVAVRTTVSLLRAVGGVDLVSFHASRWGLLRYGPVVAVVGRCARRPVVLRLFGGAIESEYESLGWIGKLLFDRTALQADLLLVETKALARYLASRGARTVRWYPNSRPMSTVRGVPDQSVLCRRFVFLGRVCSEKGVKIILDIAKHLRDRELTIDIFGSLAPPYTKAYIESMGMGSVHYRGIIDFSDVPKRLADYHALLLPTMYEGEGYPGAVLEAYSAGLPVITSAWRAIPEIVDEQCGILIEPGSSAELLQAMYRLNEQPRLYKELREGVLRKRDVFCEEVWTAQFLAWSRDLVVQRQEMLS